MNNLQERIAFVMQECGLSLTEIARITGVSTSAVAQWKEGPSKSIRTGAAARLAAATGFNTLWLSTGEGPRGAGPAAAKAEIAILHAQPVLAWESPDDLVEGEFIFIPALDVRLSAGHGAEQLPEVFFDEARPIAFRADWIRKKHLRPKALVALLAQGDSMEPRIQHGDSLVVDTSQREIVDGAVYALWYEGGERVKRLSRLPGGKLRISSDNKAYDPITLSADELEYVRIIGRVVHVSGEGGL